MPADDYTDPAPATAFTHLDSTVNLERSIADKGIYPAVDPLASSSRILSPEYVGDEHYRVARLVQQTLQRYRDLQDIIAILGVDEPKSRSPSGVTPPKLILFAVRPSRSLPALADVVTSRRPSRSSTPDPLVEPLVTRMLLSPLPYPKPGLRPLARIALFLMLMIAAGLAWSARRVESPPLPLPERFRALLASRPAPGEVDLDLDRAAVPQPFVIRAGQTLGGLLMELGLEPPAAYAAVATLADYLDVRKIRAGETGVASFDEAGLDRLRLDLAGKGRAELARDGEGWRSSWREFERRTEVRRVAGELDDFLERAVTSAGGPPQLAYAMADVLQWDLDFNRDLRVGDRFRVVYDEIYLDGELHDVGRVLALVYQNLGRRLEAYRFGDGYYDGDGRPLRKMFLRSPMRYTRVTSRFSHRRFHPVLKVHRPHYGVDYGAPRGTPARVTASGVVTFVGRKGGAGNMVTVRHPNGYETSYLHLSGYGPGIRRGRRVSQGDTIGYVGATGLATAPHLDYRMRKDGRWIDPLKLRSEPARPIPAEDLDAFLAERDRLRAELGVDPEASPEVVARAGRDLPRRTRRESA